MAEQTPTTTGTTLPRLRNLSSAGFNLSAEFHNVPNSFVNGIRRIVTGETPVLKLGNIQVLENSSSMVHEQVKHRLSELPILMRPSAEGWDKVVITLDVTVAPTERTRDVTTADLQVQGAPADIIMHDKDFGDPILLLRLAGGQAVKATAGLELDPYGSLVCPASLSALPDAEKNKEKREAYLAKYPKEDQDAAGKVFDKHYAQLEFVPNAFRFTMETDGTTLPRLLLREAVTRMRAKMDNWFSKHLPENMQRDPADSTSILVQTPDETHTLGALLQDVLCAQGPSKVHFVSYEQPHPLVRQCNLRMHLGPDAGSAQAVFADAHKEILGMCDDTLAAL